MALPFKDLESHPITENYWLFGATLRPIEVKVYATPNFHRKYVPRSGDSIRAGLLNPYFGVHVGVDRAS